MAGPLSLFINMPNNDEKQEPTLTMAISTKPAEPARRSTTTNQSKKPTTNKCQTRKKQPQRGMGVAQLERLRVEELERLRIQERWKAITEANQNIGSLNLQPSQQFHVFDPFNYNTNNNSNQMLQYGTTDHNCGVPMISNGGVNGFLGWDHQGGVVVKRVDGSNMNNNGGFGSGQVIVKPYMVGSAPVHQVGTPAPPPATAAVFEASKELSSIPKAMQQQQQYEPSRCDLCFKMGGFSARAARSALYASHNQNNNTAMTVHRKGNNPMGRNVIMEYEFFPGKHGKNTCFKEMEFPTAEASVTEGAGEASNAYSDYSASNASNSIDLSLKL